MNGRSLNGREGNGREGNGREINGREGNGRESNGREMNGRYINSARKASFDGLRTTVVSTGEAVRASQGRIVVAKPK